MFMASYLNHYCCSDKVNDEYAFRWEKAGTKIYIIWYVELQVPHRNFSHTFTCGLNFKNFSVPCGSKYFEGEGGASGFLPVLFSVAEIAKDDIFHFFRFHKPRHDYVESEGRANRPATAVSFDKNDIGEKLYLPCWVYLCLKHALQNYIKSQEHGYYLAENSTRLSPGPRTPWLWSKTARYVLGWGVPEGSYYLSAKLSKGDTRRGCPKDLI